MKERLEKRLAIEREEEEKKRLIKVEEEKKRKLANGDIPFICELLQNNDPTVKIINLQKKNLKTKDLTELCDALVENTSVTQFDPSNNPIDDSCVFSLCKLIRSNITIKKLYLEETFIRDYGSILDALEENFTIIDMTLGKFASEEDLDDLDELLDRNEKKK